MQTTDIIKEQIINAPDSIQDFLEEDSWPEVINNLSDENNLSEQQTTSLENEVLFTLLGMSLLKDLKLNIQRELGVDDSTSNTLYQKLYENIFKGIEKELPIQEELEDEVETTDPHPATIPGETVREVPRVEEPVNAPRATINPEPQTTTVETPKPSGPQYKGGQDPYREPLQ